MKTFLLKLKFNNPSSSWIIPGDHSRDKDGWPLLTPHCAGLEELEWHIDQMQAELEEIRKQARKEYAAAKSNVPAPIFGAIRALPGSGNA